MIPIGPENERISVCIWIKPTAESKKKKTPVPQDDVHNWNVFQSTRGDDSPSPEEHNQYYGLKSDCNEARIKYVNIGVSVRTPNLHVCNANRFDADDGAPWVKIQVNIYIPEDIPRSADFHTKPCCEKNPKVRFLVVKGIYCHSLLRYFPRGSVASAPWRTWMSSTNPKKIRLAAISKHIWFRHISCGTGFCPFENIMMLPTLDRVIG